MKRSLLCYGLLIVLLVAQLAIFKFFPDVYAASGKFGYETIGGSTSFYVENFIAGSVFTIPEDGTADSITVALAYYAGYPQWTGKLECAIYRHSDLSLKGSTEERTIALTNAFAWYTFNFTGTKPSLIATTAYVLVVWGESATGYATIAYSAGDTNQGHRQPIVYSGSFPDPLVPAHSNDKFSVYCTYTLEAVEDTTPPTYSDVGTNTTQAEQACLFYTKWTDETGLATTGGYIFGTNNTESWQNETWTPFTANPDWSNVTKTLTTAIGARVEWTVWANDTSNNWNNTGTQYLIVTAPESTFYSSTSDGYIQCESATWSGSRDAGTGTVKVDNGESFASAMATTWSTLAHTYTITRSFFYFDTSSLPDNATITSVTLSLYKSEYGESYVSAQKGTQADTLVLADFDSFTGSEYGHAVWTGSAYKSITFNAQGLSDINKTGTTKICTREYNHDYLNVDSGGSLYRNGAYYSEYSGTVADPKLVITWTTVAKTEYSFYGIASLTFIANILKTISFNRYGTATLTFISAGTYLKSQLLNFLGLAILSFATSVSNALGFGRYGTATLTFASNTRKTMQFNRYGEAVLTFTSTGEYLSGVFLNLFGSALLTFMSVATKAFEFCRYGATTLTFTTGSEKMISFARYGMSSLTFIAESLRSLSRTLSFGGLANLSFLSEHLRTFTFNRYGTAPLTFTVESLTQGLGTILTFFGSASLIFTIQTTVNILGETLQNAKIFVAAAFIMATLIGIPLLILVMSRRRS